MVAGILIPIAFFITAGLLIHYFLKYRYQERQMIIEKGLNGEDLKLLLGKRPKRESDGALSAKIGILAISIGLAILIGSQFDEEIIWGLIFLFPGIGLLIYYRIFTTNQKEVE